jgi:hypothetical protein
MGDEMSQAVVNADSSSVKAKRQYRKGHALTTTERKLTSLARKRATHKEVKIFVQDTLKAHLMALCEEEGVTQAEMIERWILREIGLREQGL